jgi:hypothetical protein
MTGKDIVRSFLELVWNERKPDEAIARFRDVDCISRGLKANAMDTSEYRGFIMDMQKRMTSTHIVVEDLVEEGNKVAFRATITGEIDGKTVSLGGFGIVMVGGGKILDSHNAWDGFGLMAQLGGKSMSLADVLRGP